MENIICKLEGTNEVGILKSMENCYQEIMEQQKIWYEKSQFNCPDSCGECCRGFEPDLLESEAVFMAAWLIENQPEIAEKVAQGQFPFPREKFCQFWDENANYHCSIYGGRPAICRLFGASSSYSKNNEIVWKPCKFYPADDLLKHKPPLTHRQYSDAEVKEIFGILPPPMRDLMEKIVAENATSNETKLIRDILPTTIQKLLWKISMIN